jgi:ATP-dependent DNA helicase RecG
MNRDELDERIRAGENLHTEFKEWPARADSLAGEIVAFANTDGGELLVGVEDSGNMIGIARDALDSAAQRLDNIAYNNCEPPVTILQETVAVGEDGAVLIVRVPKGDQRPYRTNRGIYFIRTSSGKRQASRSELLSLFQAARSLYYDETILLRSSVADLATGAFDELLREMRGQEAVGIPPDRLQHNWQLTAGTDSGERPTVAGMLFLGAQPQRFLPHAYISALRIPGSSIDVEPSDRLRIEGRVLPMIDAAARFLELHLRRRHEIRDFEPEDLPEIPGVVLREAVINAIAHRDYAVTGPIRLIIFDDRIEVRTPGGLPNSVELEALPFGVHLQRNPTIYNMLLKAGRVTDAGSGIPRMIRALEDATGEKPALRLQGGEFVVGIPRQHR